MAFTMVLQYHSEKPIYSKFVSNEAPIVFTQCKRASGGGYLCMPDMVGYMPIRLYGIALLNWFRRHKKENTLGDTNVNSEEI